MSHLDLPTIKALAEKATPGPWTPAKEHTPSIRYPAVKDADGRTVAKCDASNETNHAEDLANTAFIAAASPATVLALIARVEKDEAELRTASSESISARCHRTRYQCCDICESPTCGDNTSRLRTDRDQARADLAAAQKVVEAAKAWLSGEPAQADGLRLHQVLASILLGEGPDDV